MSLFSITARKSSISSLMLSWKLRNCFCTIMFILKKFKVNKFITVWLCADNRSVCANALAVRLDKKVLIPGHGHPFFVKRCCSKPYHGVEAKSPENSWKEDCQSRGCRSRNKQVLFMLLTIPTF